MYVVKVKGFYLCPDGRFSDNRKDAFRAVALYIAKPVAAQCRHRYGKKKVKIKKI